MDSGLALANRGGAKTFIVAVLHYASSTYKPGYQGLTFGASEAQANRCYEHIEDWCYDHDDNGRRLDTVKPFIRGKPLKSETVWRTGSKIEIVAGSLKAVSGPHPSVAHADEFDQMDDEVWNQSRGMAVSNPSTGTLPNFMEHFGKMIPPQDIATSTRNSLQGLMHNILEEVAEDLKEGNIPQYEVFIWCIFECLAEVPNCRNAPKKEREARLKELGRDPCELCECNRVFKGMWNTEAPLPALVGQKRSLQDVCAVIEEKTNSNGDKVKKIVDGKAFRSRGWKPYIDFVQTFKRNTAGTWVLQHECREGKDENNYLENWSLELYGIRGYQPHPQYGPIYESVDWGTTHPASVLMYQYLKAETPALDFNYQPIYLAANTYVLFHEIYVTGLGPDGLAKRVVDAEANYRTLYPGWKVKGRFCDPQGKGERITFANYGLKSYWPVKTRDKQRMITIVQNLVIDDRFVVDVDQAEAFCTEAEIWQKDPKTDKEIDKFNHSMASWRYGISNAEVIEGNERKRQGGSAGVVAGQRRLVPTEEQNHASVVSQRGHASYASAEGREAVYGSVAFRGGSAVVLDPQFSPTGLS